MSEARAVLVPRLLPRRKPQVMRHELNGLSGRNEADGSV